VSRKFPESERPEPGTGAAVVYSTRALDAFDAAGEDPANS